MQKKDVSFGICGLCKERLSKLAMPRHLASCAPVHGSQRGKACTLFHLRVEGAGIADYWIDLEIKGSACLLSLDNLLREVWLECCGHMSAFKINKVSYVSMVDDEFDSGLDERDMNIRISDVLMPGQKLIYEYDFGSTTDLTLRVLGTRGGVMGKSNTTLLARNEPPVWSCDLCSEPATVVCAFCMDDGHPFSCKKHQSAHACGEGGGFLPVVNSPRMGVCGYTGYTPIFT